MKHRIRWIDIAKGICMLSVILGHMASTTFAFTFAYHLPVFFILSGYTLKKKKLTKEYLHGKFSSLMTPYFLTCLGIMTADIINAVFVQGKTSTAVLTNILYTDLVRSFFGSGTIKTLGSIEMGAPIGAIWFLPAMFFALLFTQLILNNVQRKRSQALIGVAASVIACIAAEIIWLPFSILSGIQAIPLILMGMWLKEYQLLEKMKFWHYGLCGVVFLLTCTSRFAQRFYMVTCHMEDWLLTPVIVICASFLILGISKLLEKCKYLRFLEFIGKNSLIVLCLHKLEIGSVYPLCAALLPVKIENNFLSFTVRILFITVATWLLSKYQQRTKKLQPQQEQQRDRSIDILRAGLISLMLVGHISVLDPSLKSWIYGFHMLSFVMVSGYFYKPQAAIAEGQKVTQVRYTAGKYLKLLAPYCVFALLYVILTKNGWQKELSVVLMGISHTNKLFTNIASVGPVYFIPMLFCIRVFYDGIIWLSRKLSHSILLRNIYTYIFVLLFAIVGILLGRAGFWLPWSVDISLFALLFFHIGQQLRQFDVLKWCEKRPYLYFIFSCIWAFMVHQGSQGLSTNRYSHNIGIAIIGAVSAFVAVYLLCVYLKDHLPRLITTAIATVGQSTAHILVIHTLFGNKITSFIVYRLGLPIENISFLIVYVGSQLLMGVVSFLIIQLLGSRIRMLAAKKSPA